MLLQLKDFSLQETLDKISDRDFSNRLQSSNNLGGVYAVYFGKATNSTSNKFAAYFNDDEVEKIPDNGQEWKAWPSTHPAHGDIMLTRFYFNDRLNVMLGHYDDANEEWTYFYSGDCPPTKIKLSQVDSGLVKGFFYRNPDLIMEKEK